MLSTKRILASGLLLLSLAALLSSCKAMADPNSSDLPWTQTNEWEFAPNVPRSMFNR